MNHIYIGDRQLDPPEDEECAWCNDFGFTDEWDDIDQCWYQVDCNCQHELDPEPYDDPADIRDII